MPGTIFVINPNSLTKVTAGIDAALEPLRIAGAPPVACLTLPEGPPGIQSQRDVDAVVAPLLSTAAAHEDEAAAFVIACFSDPGLYALREQSRRPVLGIAECGVLSALTMGARFGVISILPASIPRHLRYFGAMGVLDRLAATDHAHAAAARSYWWFSGPEGDHAGLLACQGWPGPDELGWLIAGGHVARDEGNGNG